jgi:hypothetical protein
MPDETIIQCPTPDAQRPTVLARWSDGILGDGAAPHEQQVVAVERRSQGDDRGRVERP